jgi:hypothetical protein
LFDGTTNQFGLNLVELVLDKTPGPANSRTGYHGALVFGQATNAINASEPKGSLSFDQFVKEAYFSYLAPVGKGLQVEVGKFVTSSGPEVIKTKDDSSRRELGCPPCGAWRMGRNPLISDGASAPAASLPIPWARARGAARADEMSPLSAAAWPCW